MSRFLLLTGALTLGLASGAAAQLPGSAAPAPAVSTPAELMVSPVPVAPAEREVNQLAAPVGDGLSLYTEPNEASKPIRLSAWRQIKVRTIIDSTWCRAVYGGAQFYAKRADIRLVAPGSASPVGSAPAAK